MTLDEYKAREARMNGAIRAAEMALMELRHERTLLRLESCGIKVGHVVWFDTRKGDQEAIVRGVQDRPVGEKPWLTVSLKRKDGSWSDATRTAYASSWRIKA